MSGSDSARVTTFVGVSPEDAFAVFTEQIDQWWRRGPRFRGGDSIGLHWGELATAYRVHVMDARGS
jgi:hypothetical protein